MDKVVMVITKYLYCCSNDFFSWRFRFLYI